MPIKVYTCKTAKGEQKCNDLDNIVCLIKNMTFPCSPFSTVGYLYSFNFVSQYCFFDWTAVFRASFSQELPGGPVVRTLCFHCIRARVQSLFGELRYYKLGQKKKECFFFILCGDKTGPVRGFLVDPVVKNLPCNAGDMGLLPGWGTKIPHDAEPERPN